MADTIIQYDFPGANTLQLYAEGSDTVANTGGDVGAAETNRTTTYKATVAEALTGWYRAYCLVGSISVPIGWVFITADDTNTYRVRASKTLYDWEDGNRLDLLIDAIPTTAMRGTDSAATAAALATAQTDLDAITGADGVLLATSNQPTGWPANLAASAGQIIIGTVDTVTNTHTPTTTEFQADDVTEATADHYNGRVIIFTSGVLAGQATSISDYAAVGGIGQFTVVALTEAPANNDTFIIV